MPHSGAAPSAFREVHVPHLRHRPHNVRDQHPERSIVSDMCSVVIAGERIHVRGQTGFDIHPTARRFHGSGDPAAQAEQAMRNVAQLLGEVGARLEHVCKVKVWVTDRDHLPPVMAVLQRHLGDVCPAYTEVVVDGLARAELLMEVDVDVVVPPEDLAAIRVPQDAPPQPAFVTTARSEGAEMPAGMSPERGRTDRGARTA